MMNKLEMLGGGAISAITYFIGGADALMIAVGLFMFMDLASGLLKSYITGTLNSRKDWARKGFYVLFLLMAVQLDYSIGQSLFRSVVAWYVVGTEGISIFENAVACGLKVPTKLLEKFEQLKGDSETEEVE